jgi:hypothetical protein
MQLPVKVPESSLGHGNFGARAEYWRRRRRLSKHIMDSLGPLPSGRLSWILTAHSGCYVVLDWVEKKNIV